MTVPHPPEAPQTHTSAADPAADPLARLHHMSTTAGVASQRYVAVNIAAIIAASLGVASTLAVFSSMLLVIPAVGVIVAILAWRQIRNSGGTETGTPLAIFGLALSLLIGGGRIAQNVRDYRSEHADIDQMSATFLQLADDLRASHFDQAYQLFDSSFQGRISPETFRSVWKVYQSEKGYGPLQSMQWNGVPPMYQSVHGGDERLGYISAIAKFQKTDLRLTLMYRNGGDGWHLENIGEFFGEPK